MAQAVIRRLAQQALVLAHMDAHYRARSLLSLSLAVPLGHSAMPAAVQDDGNLRQLAPVDVQEGDGNCNFCLL